MLADTPPTFLLFFGWILLALAAPIAAVVAVVLVIRRKTRRLGGILLLAGAIGSVFAAVGDAALAMIYGGGISDTTVGGWVFALAGGFSLFGIPAALIAFERGRRANKLARQG